jgi:hypothetical protein
MAPPASVEQPDNITAAQANEALANIAYFMSDLLHQDDLKKAPGGPAKFPRLARACLALT